MEVACYGILAPSWQDYQSTPTTVLLMQFNTTSEDQNIVINKVTNHTKARMNRLKQCLTGHSQVLMWLLVQKFTPFYGFFWLYTGVASGSAPRKEASSVEDIWKGPAKKTVDKTRYMSLLLKDPDRRASRSFILIIFSLAPVVRKVDNAIRQIIPYPLDSAFGFPHTYSLDSDVSGG